MSWERLYNFQAGTKIASGQVNGELNQLIDAANTLEIANTDTKASAQMLKITDDLGGQNISVTDTSISVLNQIVTKGKGFNTFYAVGGSLDLPNANSMRGISHLTDTSNGYVLGVDFTGGIFSNAYRAGVWQGWNPQTSLWSGIAYPSASQTITPSKKLSQCQNGWILVWSDYDSGVGANDADINYSYIPKGSPFLGKTQYFTVANYLSNTTLSVIVKRLTVNDATLVGHDDNNISSTSTNDVCLRNVLEY